MTTRSLALPYPRFCKLHRLHNSNTAWRKYIAYLHRFTGEQS